MQSLLSMRDLDRAGVDRLLDLASGHQEGSRAARTLPFVLGIFFFEASTRTQLGFEAAAYRLGGDVIKMNETKLTSSMSAAESFEDTIRAVQSYADILCIRSPDEDAFSRAKDYTSRPIINAGDGHNEHPTQALTDLFTIREKFGRTDDLEIAVVGDLRHMRTAHSFVLGLSLMKNIRLRLISPKELVMPEIYTETFTLSGNTLVESDAMSLDGVDVIYMTGFAPNTPVGFFDDKARNGYRLGASVMRNVNTNSLVLCPLPRIDEIDRDVDSMTQAGYFKQSENGLFVRMAVLDHLLYNRNHAAS